MDHGALKIGSLFSGVGGLELGLERAGLGRVSWQVEIDPFCRSVLAKHWPEAVRYEDVRSIGKATVAPVDVVCGGFPCTDLSHAARGVARAGLAGEHSGLWREMLRVVSELAPRFVVIENVASAWRDWLPHVRRDLHELGYSCMPVRMRAADVGSPMGRARIFVAAYTDRDRECFSAFDAEVARASEVVAARADWAADPAESLGVPHGISARVDRLRTLGNAVVPQCAEVIGRAIVNATNGGSDV